MENDKLKGYLNISRKAGYLIIGGETLEDYKKKLFLVLYDPTAGNTTLKIVAKIRERGVKVLELENLDQFCSIANCKIVGIKNKNISEIIEKIIVE